MPATTLEKEFFEEFFTSIRNLQKIRKGIPQFLFSDNVFPEQTFHVRKAVMDYKFAGNDCTEVDLIVNSPGGFPDDAYRIIRNFRKNFETVNIIVPFWAKSAATLLSLGGTNIIMDEFGEFGPLDAQLGKQRDDSPEIDRESALNDEHSLRRIETRFKEMFETMFIRIYEHKKINIPKAELSEQLFENLSKFYEPLLKQINPYKLGDKRRKLDLGGQYAKRILAQFNVLKSQTRIRDLVDFLVDGCPDHGYVIDYDIIINFLDNVKTSTDAFGTEYANELYNLSMLFLGADISFVGFVEANVDEETKEEAIDEMKENTIKPADNIVIAEDEKSSKDQ